MENVGAVKELCKLTVSRQRGTGDPWNSRLKGRACDTAPHPQNEYNSIDGQCHAANFVPFHRSRSFTVT